MAVGTRLSSVKNGKLTADGGWSNAVYPVFSGGPYATIAAAIAQAQADGHTTIGNGAVILVSPKTGGWTEDVILTTGLGLQGVWSANDYTVQINGKVSYTPGVLGVSGEKVNVQGLYIKGAVGKPCLELVGVNVGQMYVTDCVLDKTENTAPNVSLNGNASSLLLVDNCIGDVPAGGTAYDVESGTLQAITCAITSNVAARGLKVGAAGVANFYDVALVANGADVVNVASGGAYAFEQMQITQVTAGNSGIVQVGTPPFPTGLCIFSLFNVPTGAGYAAKGTGILSYGSNVFIGNVKFQNPGLTLVSLPIVPTLTP